MKKYLNSSEEKLTKGDIIGLGIVVFLYAVLSFINLGSNKAPQTFLEVGENEEVIIEFSKPSDLIKIKLFNGNLGKDYKILTSLDNENFDYVSDLMGNGAFSWNEIKPLQKAKYVKIIPYENSTLGEIALYNNSQKKIKIKKIILNEKLVKKLTDEQDTVPKQISHLNSTYFDEIYFARTAYEYANGLRAYEWTHPPLGKLIQSIPIKLFKMAPFYYRLMGNIAGILMIIVMYFFGKELFGKRKYALMSALVMALDCFHFAQTRMGTVDSFLVLFILLAGFYMYKYIKTKKERKNLLLSGFFMGCSMAVKWSGCYLALALAIIFLVDVIKNKKISKKLFRNCLIYFVAIPIIIYVGSYLIYPNIEWLDSFSLKNLMEQTVRMFNYHASLNDTHFFSSPYYTWPFSYKPVWYYSQDMGSNLHAGITGVGNVAIWWVGVVSFLYMIYRLIRKKQKEEFFLLVMIIVMFIPNIFIGRVMFLYHYFPVLPFIMLGIVLMFKDISTKIKKDFLIYLYLIIVLLVFIVYYPAISGMFMNKNYFEYIKIFKTWYF